MNPYTAQGRTRIRQRDVATLRRTDAYLAGTSLEALERQRAGQAEAEVNGLLKRHGATPQVAVSVVSTLRRAISTPMIRAGRRLVGSSRTSATEQPAQAPVSQKPAIAEIVARAPRSTSDARQAMNVSRRRGLVPRSPKTGR